MKIKRRIYIAGPMRGKPEANFAAFDEAAKRFRKAGWEVVNPAELDRLVHIHEYTTDFDLDCLRDAMKRDLVAICDCDAIALLPGWENSEGAAVELKLATLLELSIVDTTTMRLMTGETS